MRIAELAVRRHVLAWMLSAVFVLFGIVAFGRMGIDYYPRIDFPVVSVMTVLPGANPDIVDSSVTNVVETAVNSIPGLDSVQSRSSPGVSVVVITFDLEKNLDVGFTEVQAKVNQVLRQLPEDADPPVVSKVEVGAAPVMWLNLQGDRTLQQLGQYARQVIKKRLETISGVGQVQLGGERRRTIRVNLDLDRMAGLGVTAQDVATAFRTEHVQLPGGFLVSGGNESLIKLDLEYHRPADLAQMIVRYSEGATVKLGDIATIEDGLADDRTVARYNGEPAIGLGIVKIANSNTVKVVDEVRRRVDTEIAPYLPAGLKLTYAVDDSEPVRAIIKGLNQHLVEGTILAGLVVWFFLRSTRSTLIIATSIPVSLLGAVAVMYFLGYTFNQMTLLGLLLLIGVVVDDAIVVLENIFRRREEGDEDPVVAAIEGTQQVVFAVIASSLTLVSIFASVLFVSGIVGRFLASFAVVVTVGVMVSLIVSLTLTPMLCSRYLSVKEKHGPIYQRIDRFLARMDASYRRLLAWALKNRKRVLLATLAVVLSSGVFFTLVKKDFFPENDVGRTMITFRTPLGTSREATTAVLAQIEALLARRPEVHSYFTGVGFGGQVNTGIAFVMLKPRNERDISQGQFAREMTAAVGRIPGVVGIAAPPSPVSGSRSEPVQFSVVGPELSTVSDAALKLDARLERLPGWGVVDLDLQLDLPQIRVDVDRERAAEVGLTSADIGFAVNMLAGGVDIARYTDDPGDGDRYDIRVKAAEGTITSADDLNRIFLRGKNGQVVRLDSVAHVTELLGPAVVSRYQLQYSANFFANPTVPLGDAVKQANKAAADLLPPGYKLEWQGRTKEFTRSQGYLAFTFGMAMILVYIVLASQFNSFLQPLIVMTAQPLAIVGGLFALWITGHALSMISTIGLTLLIGLVAKNSILLVDLTNQMRAAGKPVDEALLTACPIRLRPVLMTSFTVILALLPAALGFGAGAETNAPLSVAVIGGMLSSTLLTLVVVPTVYSLLESERGRMRAMARELLRRVKAALTRGRANAADEVGG